jgi:hypothetical protein
MNQKSNWLVWVFLTVAILTNAQGKQDMNWRDMLSKFDMVWTKMPMNYYEGPFVGNGLLGTIFFKDTILDNTIAFEIGRVDVYDHRTADQIKDKYPWPKVRLPIGKLLLSCNGKIRSVYFKTSLWDAKITGTIKTDKGSVELTCYTPTDEKIIVLNYIGTGGESTARTRFRPEQGNNARAPLRTIPGKVYEPNPPFIEKNNLGIHIITQPLLNGDNYATAWDDIVLKNGMHSVYVTVANNWAEKKSPFNESDQTALLELQKARHKQADKILQHHLDWWHAYYPKSYIQIPNSRLLGFYWLQQYRIASATRPDTYPIDLMGPWYKPSVWLSIWANLNLQLNYYTTGVTNHLDMEAPYFNMIEKNANQLILNVPKNFQNDCAALQTVIMFNDLSGNVFLNNDSSSKQKMSLIALPWMMQQFYIHYRYDLNEERLRNSIYPLMRKAYNVYLRTMYMGSDHHYHLPLSFSDEYGEDYDVSMNLALARWGFKTLLDIAQHLQIQDTLVPKWQDALANLTPYPMDSTGIKLGRNQQFNKPHRHYSHLFCIFPLYEMNMDEDPEKIPLMHQSIQHFTDLEGDNCMFKFTGAASLWAALGNGDQALKWLERAVQILPYSVPTVTPNGFYSENGWPTFESPIAATRSMLDMLLQTWGNTIRIFPAMPTEWKDAKFYDLRAEGGFQVSAERIHGKTSWIKIQSIQGTSCQLKVPDWHTPIICSDKTVVCTKMDNGTYHITLKKGGSAIFHLKAQQTNIQSNSTHLKPSYHWGLN